ncbi:hypothetical protein LX36DRAFT_654688 [Colletotrichum falcatum]|nr:hypothetical protein LX36DRAFT_654688 [Colletotrichum falcatum]
MVVTSYASWAPLDTDDRAWGLDCTARMLPSYLILPMRLLILPDAISCINKQWLTRRATCYVYAQ